jgi:hypothetical protein
MGEISRFPRFTEGESQSQEGRMRGLTCDFAVEGQVIRHTSHGFNKVRLLRSVDHPPLEVVATCPTRERDRERKEVRRDR